MSTHPEGSSNYLDERRAVLVEQSSVAVLDSDHKKLKRALDKLNQMQSILADTSISPLVIFEIAENVNFLRLNLLKLIENNKQEKAKVKSKVNTTANDYTQNIQIYLNENMGEASTSNNNDLLSSNQAESVQELEIEKPKSIIIKTEIAKELLKQIKPEMLRFSTTSVSLLGNDKIFVNFEKDKECKEFKRILEKTYTDIKIFVEEDESVDVLIFNPGFMPYQSLENEIEKITNEKPSYISVVEQREKEYSVVYIGLTSKAFLLLQAHHESIIDVRGVKYNYTLQKRNQVWW